VTAVAATLDDLLRRCVAAEASDLHLSPGQPPVLRVHGELERLGDLPALDDEAIGVLLRAALNPAQEQAFAAERTLDLARSLPEGPRFRINAFTSQGRTALAVRRLDDAIRGLDELRLPPALARIADLPDGLCLVTGPTGSGKSTTLATLIDAINRGRACHVLTLEDPIEYLHPSRRALVHQRELHTDFERFARALRSALREDPDVILVGEMRDVETMRAALTAAETGHLVLSTLHAGDAVGAAERLIGAFPSGERDSVRYQLSLVLRAAVAQRLLPLRDGGGRVPVVEVLWSTPAVANLIRAGKAAQLYATMESQTQAGMLTMEQSLAEACARGWVAEDVARRTARDPKLFAERLRRARAGGRAPWR